MGQSMMASKQKFDIGAKARDCGMSKTSYFRFLKHQLHFLLTHHHDQEHQRISRIVEEWADTDFEIDQT